MEHQEQRRVGEGRRELRDGEGKEKEEGRKV